MIDWANTTRRHGTQSGYRMHQDLGEKPCDACTRAKSEYDARHKAAPAKAIKARRHAKAQMWAMRMVASKHLVQYRKFYAQAKEELEAGRELPPVKWERQKRGATYVWKNREPA